MIGLFVNISQVSEINKYRYDFDIKTVLQV